MVDIPVNNEDPGFRQCWGHCRGGPPTPRLETQPRMGREWVGTFCHLPHPAQPGTHLCSPCFCLACSAAIATLLNTQNPLAAALWLWCPGGLEGENGVILSSHGASEGWGQVQGAALTSLRPAHCVRLPSAQHPPAEAQPQQPALHSERYSVGAGMQISSLCRACC